MPYSRLRGLPVVSAGARGGKRLGTVGALTVDVSSGEVTHLRVRRGRLRGGSVLPWSAVEAVGPEAVRVRVPGGPVPVPEHHELIGRPVLTDAGEDRGTVLDVAFDPATGRLEAVLTTSGVLPPQRLRGLGDHALVVRAAPAGRRNASRAPGL
ncbi:PRC-barrel domain-containing protein [Streptomyces sp. enrichment culture]|uniref:PRC-barrel domain-containing protein n=1 Tax=Streptomyces sp. enrichment culture TaxID=1795815 RepID=UPI003F560C07